MNLSKQREEGWLPGSGGRGRGKWADIGQEYKLSAVKWISSKAVTCSMAIIVKKTGTSLVVQWIEIHLPTQEM